MKNIAIIGTVGVPACYGGFETLVDNLLDFAPKDVSYTVFCSKKNYKEELETYKGAKLVYLPFAANGIMSILYDFLSMLVAVKNKVDIMLVLGVSGCIFLPLIRKIFKGKIITNIDGLEWKRDKWKWHAKWLLHTAEKKAVEYSDIVIGDNGAICSYVKKEYNKEATLIAYGGDQVQSVEDECLFLQYPFCKSPYAVSVCRIEKENHIEQIIQAFCEQKESKTPGLHLVIVGNFQAGEYGRMLLEKYGNMERIHLLLPIYAPHTLNWLRCNAKIYIHGHGAGGTNPSLVEAMNLGLPIAAFDCVYNRATTQNKCLYWKSTQELQEILQDGSIDAKKIADDMKEIAKQEYTWEKVAQKYSTLFS